jgi:predicted RNA-binding protein
MLRKTLLAASAAALLDGFSFVANDVVVTADGGAVIATDVAQDGKVYRGDNCVRAPDLKEGYSECAVTEYAVTFTRLS